MIIKMTLHDRGMVHYLEDFCKFLTWRMFDEYSVEQPELTFDINENSEKLREYREKKKAQREKRERLLDITKKYRKRSKEQKEIIHEILRLWKIYAKEHDLNRFLPKVSIQYNLTEHDRNGEELLYFSRIDDYIIF